MVSQCLSQLGFRLLRVVEGGRRHGQSYVVGEGARRTGERIRGYRRGADTYLNALVAERTFYAAQQTLTQTRLARAANLVTLYTALGGGLE